jgi:hypothetical protein
VNSKKCDSADWGGVTAPSASHDVTAGSSSTPVVASAHQELSSSSSDESHGGSGVRMTASSGCPQNAPASPSSSSTSSPNGADVETDMERLNKDDASPGKKDRSRLRKGKWTVRATNRRRACEDCSIPAKLGYADTAENLAHSFTLIRIFGSILWFAPRCHLS